VSEPGECAADRFAQFQQRPDVQRVANRYADWPQTSAGTVINLQLSFLAMARAAGKLSRAAYRKAVRDLAAESGIPAADFRILARCALEVVMCGLAASGQIAFGEVRGEQEHEL
jgi:hypothetical protein